MTEIILAITQTIIVLAVLFFFFKRESKQTELIKTFANEQSYNTSEIIKQTFSDYLKHIQKLETISVPRPISPVDTKLVQEILDRTPPMAEANQIEETEDEGVEITEQNLSRIPINKDTKVVFEGNDFPTEVI